MASLGGRVLGVLGILLYVAVGWLFLASGLVVPAPWYLVLWGIWIAGWWLVVRVFRSRSALTAVIPVGAALFWFLVVQLGEWLFGWTA